MKQDEFLRRVGHVLSHMGEACGHWNGWVVEHNGFSRGALGLSLRQARDTVDRLIERIEGGVDE